MPECKNEVQFRTFNDFFDPYNPEHVMAAAQYLSNGPQIGEFPKGFIPQDVILCNPYGIQMHILNSFASCWILFKSLGVTEACQGN